MAIVALHSRMPLDMHVNAVNAVLFVPMDSPWLERVGAFMRAVGADAATAAAWTEVLARRAGGQLDWGVELAGGTLPDGRPMPATRRYNDALLSPVPDPLPLFSWPPLSFAVDVWGPGERAGEPGTIGLELLVHRQVVHPWRAGAVLHDGTVVDLRNPEHFERLAQYGDAFADLMLWACELFEPVYALSDGMQPIGDFLAKAKPGRVRHPAPSGARLADYAWALTYWSPERVDDDLRGRLERLELPERRKLWPDGVELEVRKLPGGGMFLRARRILGSEGRSDRANVETPLASQLKLRSNNLIFRQ